MKRLIFCTLFASVSTETLTKGQMKKTYQDAMCCSSTYEKEVADTCIVDLEVGTYGGQILFDHYKEQGCCSDDSCTLTLEDCPLCTDTALDLYANLVGVSQDYYIGSIKYVNIRHYPEGSESYNYLTQENSTNTQSALNDFVVLRHPTVTDPSFAVRTGLQTQPLFQGYGCNHKVEHYIVDYVESTECSNMVATFYITFESVEDMTTCNTILSSLMASEGTNLPVRSFPKARMMAIDLSVISHC